VRGGTDSRLKQRAAQQLASDRQFADQLVARGCLLTNQSKERVSATRHGQPNLYSPAKSDWKAIALHTTPGIPQHMHPVVALVTAGVEMGVLGLTYKNYSDEEREAVVDAFPRTPHFKEDIIQAFYDGIRNKPDTTFGNVKADVIADKEPRFPSR
jgi:hypothetical protein